MGTRISILRGDAALGFVEWREMHAPAGAPKLLPRDFDADGEIDLAWGAGASVWLALNRRDDAPGTAPFGAGTFGCLGRVSIGAKEPAAVGNAEFGVVVNHAPPGGLGWLALATASSPGGFDPFSWGALLHVDPLASSFFDVFSAPADASGQAGVSVPIPRAAALAGVSVAMQSLHGHDCSSSPLSLVSSRGLAT